MADDLRMELLRRQLPPQPSHPVGGPSLRAPTTKERVTNATAGFHDWLASQPLAQLADALGLTGFGQQAADLRDPQAVKTGVITPKGQTLGGKRLGSLARTIQPTEIEAVYALKEPAIERLSDLYRIGNALPSISNWGGRRAEDALLRGFGGRQDLASLWSRLWGATSPGTSVPVNTRESVTALEHALTRPGEAFSLARAQAPPFPEARITNAPSKVPNINRVLQGELLSGDKANAMADFMVGQPRIPIDVHALYAVGSKAAKLDPELPALRALMTKTEGLPARGGLTNTDLYGRYEGALADALREIAPRRSLNQVFAELWEGARAHKGLTPQGAPVDILRKKGLLEPGAMLDPERLRATLRQSGWTAGAIAALLGGAAPSTEPAP